MKAKFNFIPESVKRILRKTGFYRKRFLRNRTAVKYFEVDIFLNEAPVLKLDVDLKKKPKVAIIKTQESLLGKDYVNPKASWLRYERFCKNNEITYGFLDITRSNWMDEAEKYDMIICHTESNPAYQEMIESKIYILENLMGKFCFPSYHEVWQYENKNRANYLYDYFRLPKIPTYVTQNREEAFELIEEVGYPFITKTTIGAASTGVRKIKTRSEAVKMINSIFCHNGLKTQYPYQRQKDYFYIQKFINDARFDLRIMLVGDMAFGYYRYPNQGDFRASGAGNYEKKAIPDDALRLAIDVRNKLNSRLMGIDLLYSETNKKYYIIETSLFNQIDTPEQLVIDGVPGYYDISDIDNIRFKEGKFWIQELILRDVILEWYDKYMTV
jgi:glutathione synthase/RimK-type ligase-like ATP-grasp enzyme